MNGVVKGMMLILMIVYVLSPVDLMPGPVDDLIVLLGWVVANKGSDMIAG